MASFQIDTGLKKPRVSIIKRVRENINSTLSDSMCIQIAIACAMRDCESVLGFILSHTLSKNAIRQKDSLKMTLDEWDAFFGSKTLQSANGGLSALCCRNDLVAEHTRVNNAFKLTLQEHEQSEMWKKPWNKSTLYIATHLEFFDEAISSCIGVIIKQDQRRIEDLVNDIDDQGIETLAVVNSLEALCNIAVSC